MKFPDAIKKYLDQQFFERQQLLCLKVATDNSLVQQWGDGEHFGLESLVVGADTTELLPLLAGYEYTEEVMLPFVSDSAGHCYHVHLFSDSGSRYVILIDARAELAERRRHQQAANEVKLALAKERRLISELVDAQAELALRRKAAEDESRRRGEYIATMSHEFRTPLTAILSHAERLMDSELQAGGADAARAISRVIHRQLWVIDNLLTRARLDADRFSVQPAVTDIRRLVDELSLVFAPLAADKGLSFNASVAVHVPVFVWVDALNLRQVLTNLLGNAIKFTADGSVGLRIDFGDGLLSFEVTDTGPGIAADQQRSLFAPFARGRELPATQGAGLGLSISRELVAAMGGEIDVDSSLGAGSAFSFHIASADCGEDDDSDESRGVRIVVCDDDADITDLLDIRLTDLGHDVTVVTDGDELIRAAIDGTVDLVIVDLNMPGVDGPSAARRLREAGFREPIIVLSGTARRQDVDYALASGCTEFVAKPPQISVLNRMIRQLTLAFRAEPADDQWARSESKQM